ncbi:MAG: alcohol dehydrogenase catalytic domain-containing protein, partial [Jatrophihabitantaceae bacterium]
MRAVRLVRAGVGPAGLDVVDLPVPALAPDEVLVEVRAVSATRLETEQTMAGVGLGRAVRLPRVLGMDPAGVVVAQGADVAGDRLGKRVAVKPNLVCGSCRYCLAGVESDCLQQHVLGVHRDGGAAKYVAVPDRAAFAIDDSLDFVQAAAAVHTVPVALHMLRCAGQPGAGATVLVLGAGGAVGSAAVQLAVRAGASVIGAVSDAAKARHALADGALHTVDSMVVT